MDAGAEQSLTARTFPPAVLIHSRREELSSFFGVRSGHPDPHCKGFGVPVLASFLGKRLNVRALQESNVVLNSGCSLKLQRTRAARRNQARDYGNRRQVGRASCGPYRGEREAFLRRIFSWCWGLVFAALSCSMILGT